MAATTTEIATSRDASQTYRCTRCGVESAEITCFIIPQRHSKPPHYIRCLTCEQRRVAPTTSRGLAVAVTATFWPTLIFLLSQNEPHARAAPVFAFITTALSYPVSVVIHELGHALTAWALGLEVAAVGIGFGPTLWRFQVNGLPIHIHTWPLSGRVFLGSSSARFLRTRVWVCTAAGPLVNISVVAVTAQYWAQMEHSVGAAVPGALLIVNALMVVMNLLPLRGSEFGRPYRSDGLALLQTPQMRESELAIYLYSAPLVRAWHRCEAEDYSTAKAAAEEALRRAPSELPAQVILAAARIGLEEYAAAAAGLLPFLDTVREKSPALRAMLWNAFAAATLFDAIGDPNKRAAVRHAESLSREAYGLFPCVLEYRAMYALMLAATGAEERALELLQYCHFDTGAARQRGNREFVRAYAFWQLKRVEEAERSAQAAITLDARNERALRRLNVQWGARSTQSSPPR